MMDLINFGIFWTTRHPFLVAGAVVAFLALTWLLNRKSATEREAERVVRNLVESSRDKYKDVRPLR